MLFRSAGSAFFPFLTSCLSLLFCLFNRLFRTGSVNFPFALQPGAFRTASGLQTAFLSPDFRLPDLLFFCSDSACPVRFFQPASTYPSRFSPSRTPPVRRFFLLYFSRFKTCAAPQTCHPSVPVHSAGSPRCHPRWQLYPPGIHYFPEKDAA